MLAANGILRFLNRVIRNEVSPAAYTVLSAAAGTGLVKDAAAGKYRPIAAPNTLYRLLGRIVVALIAPSIRAAAPHDTSIGVRNGTHLTAHAVQALWRAYPSSAILFIDLTNAFQTIETQAIARAARFINQPVIHATLHARARAGGTHILFGCNTHALPPTVAADAPSSRHRPARC